MARLELKWLPAVGAARYEVREQGTGASPLARYENGIPLGPRVDSTRFVFTGAEPRTYHLSVRAYNRSGVASPEPAEATVNPGGGDNVWIPSDVNCAMYISMDEKYDQNGDEFRPTLWNLQTAGFPFISNVAPPGSAEFLRRIRYDQGIADNHMIIQMEPNTYNHPTENTTDPPGGYAFCQSKKSSPSNHHFEALADPDTPAQRMANIAQITGLIVEPRIAGQSDVDFLENFTLCGWVNPSNMRFVGDSRDWFFDATGIHLWGRAGVCDLITPTDDNAGRGYQLWLGGPPSMNTVNPDRHPSTKSIQLVDGLGFAYLSELGIRGSMSAGDVEDVETNSCVAFWPYDFRGGLLPVTGSGPDDGKYCGWMFFAVTISPAYSLPGESVDVSDFQCWAGQIDKDNLQDLRVITLPRLRVNMWTNTTTPRTGDDLMMTIGYTDGGTIFDSAGFPYKIENPNIAQPYAMYDEMRIYNRVLDVAEVRGLYFHPGGQKRTENPLEPERQIVQP